MTQQDLFGDPRPPQKSSSSYSFGEEQFNYFYALCPSAEDSFRVRTFARSLLVEHGIRNRRIDYQPLHITIFGLGDDLRAPVLNWACAAPELIQLPAFEVHLTTAMKFSGSGAVVLIADGVGINKLYFDLHCAWAGRTPAKSDRFNPHMTLCYDRTSGLKYPTSIEPISLRFTEFVLVKSLIGDTRHDVLNTWPLRG